MGTPRFDAVVDGLVTTLRAASGLGVPGDGTTDVPVFDGPVPTDAPVMHFVAVGWDGRDDGDSVAGEWQSEWAGMGAGGDRDEQGSVSCVVIAGSGSNDFAALRSTVATTLGLVHSALITTTAVGAGPSVNWVELNRGTVQQGVSARGAFVKVEFTVGYQARI